MLFFTCGRSLSVGGASLEVEYTCLHRADPEATLLSASSRLAAAAADGGSSSAESFHTSRLDRLPLANGPAANTKSSVQRLALASGDQEGPPGLRLSSAS